MSTQIRIENPPQPLIVKGVSTALRAQLATVGGVGYGTTEEGSYLELTPKDGQQFSSADEDFINTYIATQYDPAILTLKSRQDDEGDPTTSEDDVTIFEVEVKLPLNRTSKTEVDLAVDGENHTVTLSDGIGTLEIETPEPTGSKLVVTVPAHPHMQLELEV